MVFRLGAGFQWAAWVLLFLTGIIGNANAQQTYTVKGIVTDEQNSPVPYASVALYKPDSSLQAGMASDDKGHFSLSAPSGNYYLKINFLSYDEKIVPSIQLNNDVNLGRIKLISSAIALDEVVVEAERSQMQLQLDKRVFNVGKDLTNTGSNASEILDNIPSVTVDVEGNVSLRGSQNVRILIDGKPSGLTGISSTDALRQLQGNMIESVEIITNPSARYDAEGEVGIINIILKKDTRQGFNGSVEARGGYPLNYGGSFNLNYRKKSVNLFTGYGLNYRSFPGNGYTYQEGFGDSTFVYEAFREHLRTDLSHNFRLGTEITLNPLNTITLSGLYKMSDGNNNSTMEYHDYDNSGKLYRTVIRTDNELEDEENKELAFNYRRTFKQKDRLLTADIKWMDNFESENSNLTEESESFVLPLFQRSSNIEREQNWLFQTDYIHPFGKAGKFEAGLKSQLRRLDNDYEVEQKTSEGIWKTLSDFDNHFVYTENIHAAYVMAGNKTGKISYQGGVRAEYSDITTELTETGQVNPREYINFFPSAHLSYEFNEKNNLQLSYSRRISRPRHRNLLPFFSFSDNRNFFSGNPNLNPEFTDAYELGYLKYLKRGSIMSSVYYRHTTGETERIRIADEFGFTRSFPINLSTQNSYGLEFTMNYDIMEKWSANGNFNFYRAITHGEYEGVIYHADAYSWTSRLSTKLSLLKNLSGQASFNYRAPRQTTQGRRLAMYSIDLGLAAEVLKGNGTLTLGVRDLLNSRKYRSITEANNFYSESEFQWSRRQIMLTFNYRINQKKQRPERRGGSEDMGDEDMGF